MRICYLSAGAFAHVGPYLEHFQRSGHDVRFLALSPSPPRPVPVHQLALGGGYEGGRGKWKYPLSMLRARALLRRLRPDIVHAHYATSGGLAGLVCGQRPMVITAHGTDLTQGARSPLWRPLLKAAFARADEVHAVSEDLGAMARGLGVPAEKLKVLTPGVDLSRFPAREARALRPGAELRLLCTRRLEPVYDPLSIASALALLRDRGVPFRMSFAGAGSLRPELEELCARLGLCGKVRFLGELSHSELPALLGRHDVYLSASRWDGTSLSLLEAMASGLFPVVSDIPANRAWLEDGRGGLLHAPGCPDSIAERLCALVRRPELAAAAAPLNRAAVEARGDRRESMRRLERAYVELLHKKFASRR